MGGHLAGEVASRIAIEALREELGRQQRTGKDALLAALSDANGRIRDAAAAKENAGMGTTCVSVWLEPAVATIVHVGDSRAYLVREGQLQQLTADHSVVGALVREGVLDAEAASHDARRNIITKALGAERDVAPDVTTLELVAGDRLILCSDGLTEVVRPDRILEVAAADGDAGWAADRLIEDALEGGAPDNVTVVVIDPDRLDVAPRRRGWLARLGFGRRA
jgi:protein phosphatase